MAAANVPKLYRAVIDDVLNSVREAFLDDGVDEQVLTELKSLWERKITETKAVDNNAREPDPVPVTKQSNRANNSVGGSHSSRNSQHNKEHAVQQQNQQQSQAQTHHVSTPQLHPPTVPSNNHHNQVAVNHSAGPQNLSHQLQLQTGTNIVLGPSGINYTTNSETVEGQKNTPTPAGPPKLVLVQGGIGGHAGHQFVLTQAPSGMQLPPDFFNQIANFQHQTGNVISQTQPTVVHHTSNVIGPNTIQYAAATSRQPQTPAARPPQPNRVVQLDGAHDTSDEDDDEDEYRDNDDDHDDNDDEVNDDDNEVQGEDEEPLNSEDDVSDEDPTELFDTDNVVVCQYDKITRSRNKWKFHLKDGIMNLQGKDYVFQKAVGDAEW